MPLSFEQVQSLYESSRVKDPSRFGNMSLNDFVDYGNRGTGSNMFEAGRQNVLEEFNAGLHNTIGSALNYLGLPQAGRDVGASVGSWLDKILPTSTTPDFYQQQLGAIGQEVPAGIVDMLPMLRGVRGVAALKGIIGSAALSGSREYAKTQDIGDAASAFGTMLAVPAFGKIGGKLGLSAGESLARHMGKNALADLMATGEGLAAKTAAKVGGVSGIIGGLSGLDIGSNYLNDRPLLGGMTPTQYGVTQVAGLLPYELLGVVMPHKRPEKVVPNTMFEQVLARADEKKRVLASQAELMKPMGGEFGPEMPSQGGPPQPDLPVTKAWAGKLEQFVGPQPFANPVVVHASRAFSIWGVGEAETVSTGKVEPVAPIVEPPLTHPPAVATARVAYDIAVAKGASVPKPWADQFGIPEGYEQKGQIFVKKPMAEHPTTILKDSIFHGTDIENVDSIVSTGMREGTNVSSDIHGQATDYPVVLVFPTGVTKTKAKGYQPDDLVTQQQAQKPKAVMINMDEVVAQQPRKTWDETNNIFEGLTKVEEDAVVALASTLNEDGRPDSFLREANKKAVDDVKAKGLDLKKLQQLASELTRATEKGHPGATEAQLIEALRAKLPKNVPTFTYEKDENGAVINVKRLDDLDEKIVTVPVDKPVEVAKINTDIEALQSTPPPSDPATLLQSVEGTVHVAEKHGVQLSNDAKRGAKVVSKTEKGDRLDEALPQQGQADRNNVVLQLKIKRETLPDTMREETVNVVKAHADVMETEMAAVAADETLTEKAKADKVAALQREHDLYKSALTKYDGEFDKQVLVFEAHAKWKNDPNRDVGKLAKKMSDAVSDKTRKAANKEKTKVEGKRVVENRKKSQTMTEVYDDMIKFAQTDKTTADILQLFHMATTRIKGGDGAVDETTKLAVGMTKWWSEADVAKRTVPQAQKVLNTLLKSINMERTEQGREEFLRKDGTFGPAMKDNGHNLFFDQEAAIAFMQGLSHKEHLNHMYSVKRDPDGKGFRLSKRAKVKNQSISPLDDEHGESYLLDKEQFTGNVTDPSYGDMSDEFLDAHFMYVGAEGLSRWREMMSPTEAGDFDRKATLALQMAEGAGLKRQKLTDAQKAINNTIRIKTGFFRDPFTGQWMYEVSDRDFRLNHEFVFGPEVRTTGVKAGDLFRHNELFKLYPGMKDMRIVLKLPNPKNTYRGSYNPRTKTITIVASDADLTSAAFWRKAGLSIAIHEIQHAVQHVEGFAFGTNIKDAENTRQTAQGILDAAYGFTLGVEKYTDYLNSLSEKERVQVIKNAQDFLALNAHEIYMRSVGEIFARDAEMRRLLDEMGRKIVAPLSYGGKGIRTKQGIAFTNRVEDALYRLNGGVARGEDITPKKDAKWTGPLYLTDKEREDWAQKNNDGRPMHDGIKTVTLPLSDVLHYPKLKEAHPDFFSEKLTGGVVVEFDPYLEYGRAVTIGRKITMGIHASDSKRKDEPEFLLKKLLHEITHVIQTKEGRQNGGSPMAMLSPTELAEIYNDKISVERYQELMNKANTLYMNLPGEIEARKDMRGEEVRNVYQEALKGDRGDDLLPEKADKESDAAWLARNPESAKKLQAMVDEMAKAAGYNHRGVRFGFYVKGIPLPPSRSGDLNFGPGYYIAENAKLDVGHGGVSVIRTLNARRLKELGLNPEDVEYREDAVFVKAQHPFRSEEGTNATPETKAFINAQLAYESAYQEARRKFFAPSDPVNYGTVVADLIAQERIPFDSVRGRTGREGMSSELVVQKPSQIKSSDPITRDDSGRIIPLEERFNTRQDNINFSQQDPTQTPFGRAVLFMKRFLERDGRDERFAARTALDLGRVASILGDSLARWTELRGQRASDPRIGMEAKTPAGRVIALRALGSEHSDAIASGVAFHELGEVFLREFEAGTLPSDLSAPMQRFMQDIVAAPMADRRALLTMLHDEMLPKGLRGDDLKEALVHPHNLESPNEVMANVIALLTHTSAHEANKTFSDHLADLPLNIMHGMRAVFRYIRDGFRTLKSLMGYQTLGNELNLTLSNDHLFSLTKQLTSMVQNVSRHDMVIEQVSRASGMFSGGLQRLLDEALVNPVWIENVDGATKPAAHFMSLGGAEKKVNEQVRKALPPMNSLAERPEVKPLWNTILQEGMSIKAMERRANALMYAVDPNQPLGPHNMDMKNGPLPRVTKDPVASDVMHKVIRVAQIKGDAVAKTGQQGPTVFDHIAANEPETMALINQLSPSQRADVLEVIARSQEVNKLNAEDVYASNLRAGAKTMGIGLITKGLVPKDAAVAEETSARMISAAGNPNPMVISQAVAALTPDPLLQQAVIDIALDRAQSAKKMYDSMQLRPYYISEQRLKQFHVTYKQIAGNRTGLADFNTEKEALAFIAQVRANPAYNIVDTAPRDNRKGFSRSQDLDPMLEQLSNEENKTKARLEQSLLTLGLTQDQVDAQLKMISFTTAIEEGKRSAVLFPMNLARKFAPGREFLDMIEQQSRQVDIYARKIATRDTDLSVALMKHDEKIYNDSTKSLTDLAEVTIENGRIPDNKAQRIVSTMGYLWFVPLQLSNTVMEQSSQLFQLAPILVEEGAKYGQSIKLVTEANSIMMKYGLNGTLPPEIQKLFNHADFKGRHGLGAWEGSDNLIINESLAGNPRDPKGLMGVGVRLARLATMPYQMAVRYNESIALISAYNLKREQMFPGVQSLSPKEFDSLFAETVRLSGLSQSSLGKINRPTLLFGSKNPLWRTSASMLWSLQGFTGGLFANVLRQARKGFGQELKSVTSPTERADAKKAFTMTMATLVSVAGLAGIPMLMPLLKLVEPLTEKDLDAEFTAFVNRFMTEQFDAPTGDFISQVSQHGLLHAMGMPVDISQRIAPGGLFGFNSYNGFDKSRLVGGPIGSIAQNLFASVQAAEQGDWSQAFEKGLPPIIGHIASMASSGGNITASKGGVAMANPSGWQKIGYALGLKPRELINYQDNSAAIRRADFIAQQQSERLVKKAADEVQRGNTNGAIQLLGDEYKRSGTTFDPNEGFERVLKELEKRQFGSDVRDQVTLAGSNVWDRLAGRVVPQTRGSDLERLMFRDAIKQGITGRGYSPKQYNSAMITDLFKSVNPSMSSARAGVLGGWMQRKKEQVEWAKNPFELMAGVQ